jgi:hypothetical protein
MVTIGTIGFRPNVNSPQEQVMSLPEPLVQRIRGEYREMPGLRLTFAQAYRLWQVEASTCELVLQQVPR